VSLDARTYALAPELVERLLTPALVVYLDRVRANARRVIELTGGADRWRPHVKTSKLPAVQAELVRAGVRCFKCATTREALELVRVLRSEAVRDADVLVAYPLVGPGLARLGELAERFPEAAVSVLCEDAESVRHVPAPVSVFADLDVGMRRTGLDASRTDELVALARRAGERFRGVHAYEGHVAGAGRDALRPAAKHAYDRLFAALAALERAGVAVGEVVTSGTPSFPLALAEPRFAELAAVHRVSPGTVALHDLRSEELDPELGLAPAALVLARVVSAPAPDRVTCDAGSKALAVDAGDPCAEVLGRPELVARTPSEEHLPLDVLGGRAPARGETLLLFPRHVCPTVNLAEHALLIDGDEPARIASVSARAHELSLDETD
jgi:D-serine deaminase-like pyridoxal phosphate-dependent protein